MSKPVCVVVGVGPGNGAAFARGFDREGYAVALLARSIAFSESLARELTDARAYACDVADPAAIERAFGELRAAHGDPEVVIYNAGSGKFAGLDATTLADLESAWRVNALGAAAVAKQVVPAMKRAGRGTFVLIGATASQRGGASTLAFAQGKAAQRSIGESLARELWPAGIHVALLVIDGVVDLPRTRERMADKPDSFFVKPDDVAASAVTLARQPRSTWTFELVARPFGERW